MTGVPTGAQHRWTTLSRHTTSEGTVEYQRCGCGTIAVVRRGAVLAAVPKPPDVVRGSEPRTPGPVRAAW